jgi:serine protease Do
MRTRTSIVALAGLITFQAVAGTGSTTDDGRERRRTPVVEVFESCRDAVVNIAATQFVDRPAFAEFDDIFERFFDRAPIGPRRRYQMTSVGSGFILHEAGYIVTNAHVVNRTADRKVVFVDGSEHDAEIVAMDPQTDLAILKIEADRPLKTLRLGSSSDLMIGETVIAIGNPLGYQHTVTAGVVSAIDRAIDVSERVHFEGLIQTDASINPGSSGGPLLNVLGELIGVNTAIRADAQNIGFAIPVDQMRQRLPEMLSIERRSRVEIGLSLTEEPERGVIVREVQPASAGERAGLRPGDVIERVGRSHADSLVDVYLAMLQNKPGDVVELEVRRGERSIITSLELFERPPADGAALALERLGVTLESLDGVSLQALGFRGSGALRVVSVAPESPADAIDMKPGDFLINVGGQFPATLGDLGALLEGTSSGETIRITFMRGTANSRAQWTVNVKLR